MRAKKRIAQTVALVLSLGISQAVFGENLQEVYDLSLTSDPSLQAAEAGYLAALEAKPQARSAFRPQLNANAGYELHDQSFDDSPNRNGDYDFSRLSYGLNLSQSLYNKPARVQLDQADSSISKAEANIVASRQNQIVSVAEAYFNVLSAADNLEFAKAEKDAISRQLEQSRERFEVGLIAITDVREAEAQYDLAVSQEISAENQLNIALENLQVIMGKAPQKLATLQEAFEPTEPNPTSIEDWVKLALENSLALRAATHDLDAAKLEVKKAKAGNLPTIGASASYGVQDDDDGLSEGNAADTALGLSLTWPIYNGGLTSSQTRQAEHQYLQAKESFELQRRQIVRQTRAAYLNVLASISQVKALKQALKSTQTAHETAKAGFEVGTRTAVDVLLALRETYRAQSNYASARYNYILEMFRLKQAAGTLSAADIKDINKWL